MADTPIEGRPCKKCGCVKKSKSRRCLDCKREQSRLRMEKKRKEDPDHNEKQRIWRKANKEKLSAYYRRDLLEKKFSMTLEDYDKMMEAQNGVCAICSQSCVSGRRLAVDHCHATGLIRGLLCANCNRALGLFKDMPERLMKAAAYLMENKHGRYIHPKF